MAQWYRRAAEQGHARAQLSLGLVYFTGEGVPANQVLAHMWIHISGSNGDDRAPEARAPLVVSMSGIELSQALELARVCVISGHSQCD